MQKFSMYEKERERNKAILTLKELFTDLSVHNRDKVGTTQRLRSSGAFKGPNFPPPLLLLPPLRSNKSVAVRTRKEKSISIAQARCDKVVSIILPSVESRLPFS